MLRNIDSKYIYLSHPISQATPLYAGESRIRIRRDLQISKGDPSNTLLLEFPNHAATHIDLPKHFSESGKTLNDYDPGFWFYNKVAVLNVSASADEIMDLEPAVYELPVETEMLLVKTGFQKYREESFYWEHNPGLSPGSAAVLKKRCPGLRAVGMDSISVSAQVRKDIGMEAHRTFLVENDIILVEDMDLARADSRLTKVYMFPLLVEGADGGPVTAIGEVTL